MATPNSTELPLLTYSFASLPDPLWAGRTATLELVVSNGTGAAITCQQIVVTLPVGINAADLIATAAIGVEPEPGWTLASATSGIVILVPPGGSAEIKGLGLTFFFAVTINDEAGTATVTVAETAADGASPPAIRSMTWEAAKCPIDFTLSELMAVPSGNTDIAYGDCAQLNWTATGAGVTCTLEYQPADSGPPINETVPNVPSPGTYTSKSLTRTGTVTFYLTAQVVPPRQQDNPITRQSQLTVTIEALSLKVQGLPSTIPLGGLAQINWQALNAEYCITGNNQKLPASGAAYVTLQKTQSYTITAYGADGQTAQQVVTITVDPEIGPTEGGTAMIGEAGAQGANNNSWVLMPALQGGDAVLNQMLPQLDLWGGGTRVIPITVTGGAGGQGGTATEILPRFSYYFGDPGGSGGNAIANIGIDVSLLPAQYMFAISAGKGGAGGPGASMPGTQGQSGRSVLAFAGFVVPLDGTLAAPVPYAPQALM